MSWRYEGLLSQGHAFLKHIKARWREYDDKENLRQIYNEECKPIWKREHPGSRPKSFAAILYVLRTHQYIRKTRSGEVHFFKKVATVVDDTSSSESSDDSTEDEPAYVHTRKATGRLQQAVDQHGRKYGRVYKKYSKKSEDAYATLVLPSADDAKNQNEAINVEWTRRMIRVFKDRRDDLMLNKEDVAIKTEVDVSKIQMKELSEQTITFSIKNKDTLSPVTFCSCDFLENLNVYRVMSRIDNFQIPPGRTCELKIKVETPYVGHFISPLVFSFRRFEKYFHIIRELVTDCANSTVEDLQPTSVYEQPPRDTSDDTQLEYIPGEPPEAHSSGELEKEIPLDNCRIPDSLRMVVNNCLETWVDMSDEDCQTLEHTKMLLQSKLAMPQYGERFSTLLHVEELQMEVDILQYDLKGVPMKKCKENKHWLILQVKGLSENRPSVLKGDQIFATPVDSKWEKYQGFVHQVRQEHVCLGFSQRLLNKFLDNMKFDVRFTFNRLPHKLGHRAVKMANGCGLNHVLFPSSGTIGTKTPLVKAGTTLRLRDRKLESNEEQKEAVRHIVSGTSRPAPYLVFGPPGTGKTVTIVEAIKQVLEHIPSAHVLVCAPANSAADLILQRLKPHVDKRLMVRLNALSRPWSSVPDEIQEFCKCEDDNFMFPCKSELQRYRVVVCTLITAGRLASARFPAGHFTHLIIDEAGHAVEPEAVIALAGVLDLTPGGQVVLTGDPEQLGPVIRSPIAQHYGLELSLLERLMSGEVHSRPQKEDPYDGRVVTKLLINYRSHPSILKIPNEMFYDGELRAHNDPSVGTLCGWEELPKQGFPIIFHGVIGKDCREENSPSYFNPQEAAEVERYIARLLDAKGKGIKQAHIGVIAPYRKQVLKIRQVMKKRKWDDIKVGSVEEFQGQERRVIIISTVRSNPNFLPEDEEFKLGFLVNPKRFNVAITRAKALLIVIGNPNLLWRDDHWRTFLKYCRVNGGYTGCKFVEPVVLMKDVGKKIFQLKLTEEGMRYKHEDPAWKSDF